MVEGSGKTRNRFVATTWPGPDEKWRRVPIKRNGDVNHWIPIMDIVSLLFTVLQSTVAIHCGRPKTESRTWSQAQANPFGILYFKNQFRDPISLARPLTQQQDSLLYVFVLCPPWSPSSAFNVPSNRPEMYWPHSESLSFPPFPRVCMDCH